ncbi:MAG: hypothetical protein ACLUKN_08525 [Bacilli bacterium]
MPFSEHSAQWNGKIKDLPTGAKEFDVELPKPQKEIVVNAEDFGVTPSCTTVRESLNKAIEHCKKIGASKLALKKGIYYVSQNDPIKFEKMADFTFDGGGSTFVFYKNTAAISTLTIACGSASQISILTGIGTKTYRLNS